MRVGTDCSGIEAPIQALIKLGVDFEHIFSCDIDKYVKKVSEQIYKPQIWYDDLMEREDAPEVDLYVAGFPCQAFSIAGKRKGFDDIRGSVFFGVADYIRKTRPKMFILENVKGLLSHDNGRTFQTVLDVLAGNGTINGQMSIPYYDDGLDYHLYWQVLNTKDYGVPQNRERVFLVGFRDFRDYSFPKPIPLELRLKDMLEDEVDKKYFLSEKMIEGIRRRTNGHADKGNGFKFELKNVETDEANCITARVFKMAVEDNYIKEEPKYNDKRLNKTIEKNDLKEGEIKALDTYNQSIHDVCPTLTQPHHNDRRLWDGYKIRRLTPKECFRLQGFPDSFHDQVQSIGISDTQRYKMVGNSMTVDVMAAIIKKML